MTSLFLLTLIARLGAPHNDHSGMHTEAPWQAPSEHIGKDRVGNCVLAFKGSA